MLGFASFASVGGLGRGIATGGIVLGAGEGALTVVEEGALTVVEGGALTVVEGGALTVADVSTASGFSTGAGATGFGGVDVAAVAFAEVVVGVPEAGGIVAVLGAGALVVGAAGAVVVATAAAAGQRWP